MARPMLLTSIALAGALCATAPSGRDAHALTRAYLCINYELDSAEFPPRCPQILAEFADYWRAMRDGRIYPFIPNPTAPLPPRVALVEVTGHSAEGERDANNLAFLRAARVARELGRLGVPEHLIQVFGFSNRYLEPTDRGASINRRIDIVWR